MNKGFTFFEILIIVAIIGLLLSIVLPNYFEARSRAERNICVSNQKIIYTASVMYIMAEEKKSLEEIKKDKKRLEALSKGGYIKGTKWFDCPSSSEENQDDYTMTFENGFISDIECKVSPSEHKWP